MVQKREIPQSGEDTIVTDENGDGTLAITLNNPMNTVDYAVTTGKNRADNTGILDVSSKTVNGFTLGVDNSAVLSTEIINATGNTITFADADPDTITRASGDWTTLFAVGDVITITNSTSNDGSYTIASLSATVITLIASDTLVAETNTTVTDLTFVTDDGLKVGWMAKQNAY